jgi:hypothetical protein
LLVVDSGLVRVQRSVHEEGTRQVQRIASYPKITVSEGRRGVCAATFKHGSGYHPLLAWLDNTREALAGMLRPGNANATTAAAHITVTDEALAQIPDELTVHVEQAAPQPIDRPLSALECYESRGWPNMLKANIEASEFPLSAPLPDCGVD